MLFFMMKTLHRNDAFLNSLKRLIATSLHRLHFCENAFDEKIRTRPRIFGSAAL